MIFNLYKKYKEIVLYLVFGGFTTLINVAATYALYRLVGFGAGLSSVIAWVLSVFFAYVTNKIYVFESKNAGIKLLLKEAAYFYAARLISGAIDVIIMTAAVDAAKLNFWVFKIISQVIVIVFNYFASKFFIFHKKAKKENEEERKA